MLTAKPLGTVHTVVLNKIFLKIINKSKNKDPCCGLRLLYLRI